MFPEHTIDDNAFYKTAVSTILDTYSVLDYKPYEFSWTILASFFLSRKPNISLRTSGEIQVISLATGTKCLPTSKLSNRGELVHDSHAEVLARRSALRWFMEEILRVSSNSSFQSAWITQSSDGRYALQVGVELNLYVSTMPCGDASTRLLAASQDEEMAALKKLSVPTSDLTDHNDKTNAASRGRDDYSLLGVLRTKPGRADSPSTSCMSCSDKIARWNVLGIQGALGSILFEPLYLSAIVIGDVPPETRETTVREDGERAFWARLGDINGLPDGYTIHKPVIHFTDLKFPHSRSVPNSSVESLFWISDSGTHQVLINGMKRGVAPKHRYREKSRSLICRLSLMQLCNKVLDKTDASIASNCSYVEMKRASVGYQKAKNRLIGELGPFAGWILTGSEFQNFTLDDQIGQVQQEK